ncbi:uncharacterized protein LOC111017927 [Momordica charantia]|uniref:Uncharacterized protein LOC111017927 n=1 Tax=Momordica charantia TaxID=3673 RepID=A0A6J1D5Y4_MOMCH|nr:uncharacterized protein LOC111017927 [Momordica charantia]
MKKNLPFYSASLLLYQLALVMKRWRWNESLIRNSFLEEEADIILNIPLSTCNQHDEVIWGPDKKDKFSVKSTYRLGVHLASADEVQTSNSEEEAKKWKKLWRTLVPTKVKICCWRIYNDIISTIAILNKKGIVIRQGCSFCKKEEEESSTHIFWNCRNMIYHSKENPNIQTLIEEIEIVLRNHNLKGETNLVKRVRRSTIEGSSWTTPPHHRWTLPGWTP